MVILLAKQRTAFSTVKKKASPTSSSLSQVWRRLRKKVVGQEHNYISTDFIKGE